MLIENLFPREEVFFDSELLFYEKNYPQMIHKSTNEM